jgi:hypothetical protein
MLVWRGMISFQTTHNNELSARGRVMGLSFLQFIPSLFSAYFPESCRISQGSSAQARLRPVEQ